MNIKELTQKAIDYSVDYADSVVPSKNLTFSGEYALTFSDVFSGLFGKNTVTTGKMNEHSFRQVSERLDAPPMGWLANNKSCPPELRNSIMNDLVTLRGSDDYMIRMKGETVRAVLSDQYSPFDNKDVLDLASSALENVDHVVHRAEVGDYLRAYILLPGITFPDDGNPGGLKRELHPAAYFRNSEVGDGSWRATGGLYDHVCSNGVIYGWKNTGEYIVRHRWHNRSMMYALVSNAIAEALRLSQEAAEAFFASQEVRFEGKNPIEKLVGEWGAAYGISVSAKEDWLASITSQATQYGRAKEPTLFDVVNAATYVAQPLVPVERELMERMSGDLLQSNTGPLRRRRNTLR